VKPSPQVEDVDCAAVTPRSERRVVLRRYLDFILKKVELKLVKGVWVQGSRRIG
jgi:hypothetical protein